MKFKIPRKYNVMPLTQDDRNFFKFIYYVPLKKEHWEKGLELRGAGVMRNAYKNRIKIYLQQEQNNCCAYCGIGLEAFDNSHRDHIAPQSRYPQFIFRPDNIILACPRCNGLNKKNNANTINNPVNKRYRKCNFNIVHPYFDNPSEHICYVGDNRGILIQSITHKGRETINLFELDSVYFTETRAQCLAYSFHPLDEDCERLKTEFVRSRTL